MERKKKETRRCNFCASQMPEKFKGKKTKKAGAAVKEEHLLSFADMYDNVILDTSACICIQVDIQEAYVLVNITSIDYGFGNVTDEYNIPDLQTPTECEDKEKMSELNTGCSSKASLHSKRHEDHNDDLEPLMSANEDDDLEVDYEFHNNIAFVGGC